MHETTVVIQGGEIIQKDGKNTTKAKQTIPQFLPKMILLQPVACSYERLFQFCTTFEQWSMVFVNQN